MAPSPRRRGPGRRDPWAPIGLAAALAFAALAALVIGGGALPFDAPVIAAVQGLPIPAGTWESLTNLGGGTVLVPIGFTLGLGTLATGRLRLALIVAVVLIGAAVFTELVKEAVGRPRPPGVHLVTATGYSFPSGHSLNSAATYGLLAVIAWRSVVPTVARNLAVVAGLALPFVIGVSRIALGVHYPSDVLGGWLAGLAFVAAGATAISLARAMERGLLGRAGPAPSVAGVPALEPAEARADVTEA